MRFEKSRKMAGDCIWKPGVAGGFGIGLFYGDGVPPEGTGGAYAGE